MKRFIKITKTDGDVLYINKDKINSLETLNNTLYIVEADGRHSDIEYSEIKEVSGIESINSVEEYSNETKLALIERATSEMIMILDSKKDNKQIMEIPFDTNLNWLFKIILTYIRNKKQKENE